MHDSLFAELKIEKSIIEILQRLKFDKMTAVQAAAIPEFIKKDVIVQSQTGSGKTLAYLIPILQSIYSYRSNSTDNRQSNTDILKTKLEGDSKLDPKISQISALVIVPTRELCNQIQEVLAEFDVSCEVFIGGTKNESNLITKKIEIAIGTPGRLLEVIGENLELFKHLKYLVLDECDKLLSFGFESKLSKISEVLISCSRTKKTTGLFSATLDEEVQKFSQKFLKNPTEIKITDNIPDKLSLRFCVLDPTEKIDMLFRLISRKKTIVFFNTCSNVDYFFEMFSRIYKYLDEKNTDPKDGSVNSLEGKDCNKMEDSAATYDSIPNSKALTKTYVNLFKGFALYKIHGKMDQRDRNMIYSEFEKTGGSLFCTDVAARGIDFKQIDLIINFDVPKEHSNIVHRSGRTARNGSEGQSIVFLMKNERTLVEFLKLKGIVIDEMDLSEHSLLDSVDKADSNQASIQNTGSIDYTQQLTGIDIPESCDKKLILFNLVKNLMDKDLLDLSVKGFVSYIRAYKEHILNYILNYKELNFDELAEIHYLEKIPSMAELKNVKFSKYERPQESVPVKRKLFSPGKASYAGSKNGTENHNTKPYEHEKNNKVKTQDKRKNTNGFNNEKPKRNQDSSNQKQKKFKSNEKGKKKVNPKRKK